MTREQFEALPETISRAEFVAITGIPPATLRVLRNEGRIRVWRVPGSDSRHRYLKSEVARVLSLGYQPIGSPSAPPAPQPQTPHGT